MQKKGCREITRSTGAVRPVILLFVPYSISFRHSLNHFYSFFCLDTIHVWKYLHFCFALENNDIQKLRVIDNSHSLRHMFQIILGSIILTDADYSYLRIGINSSLISFTYSYYT